MLFVDGLTRTVLKLLNANSWLCLQVLVHKTLLDAEMKHATKSGIAVACKKEERKEVTAEEESLLCMGERTIGATTAESLLHTVYFYIGKIFSLGTGFRTNSIRQQYYSI